MRILYVTPYVPSAIRVRPFNLIKGLAAQGHRITLLALAPGQERADAAGIRPYCQRLEIVPLAGRDALLNVARALLTGAPLQAAYGRSPHMTELIGEVVGRNECDVAHVEHLRASLLGRAIHGLPRIYDSVDCISLLLERTLAASPQFRSRAIAWLELARTRRYEGQLAAHYERIVATSAEDCTALQELMVHQGQPARPEQVSVLRNGVDLAYFSPQDAPREEETLVFSGKMSYHANVASVLHLAHDIMPRVWRGRPKAKLWVVGQAPPPAIRALAQDTRITVTGYVPDLRPYLAQATVAVCPIRYGVGIQNKVLEALAMATPVVTSPRACLALQVQPDEDLLVGDSPEVLAQQILRLLEDRGLRQKVGANGRRYVERHHDWLGIAADLVHVYEQAIRIYRTEATSLPFVVAP